jgi:hypothetical protein
MSGQPEPTKIGEVRQSLIREATIEDRLSQISAEAKQLSQEREALVRELGALRTARWKMMTSMDVTASGNYGYEQRVNVFLMELLKPTIAQGEN